MTVTISTHCRRQLRRLRRSHGDTAGLHRITTLINEIAAGRIPEGSRRVRSTSHPGAWRCASGDWRVLFVPGQQGAAPTVIAAGHRGHLYKEEFAQ
jgi:hypothetical protein